MVRIKGMALKAKDITGEVKEGMGTGPWYKDDIGYYWQCECGHKERLKVYSCSFCFSDNVFARENG